MMEELVQLVMKRDELLWQFDENKSRLIKPHLLIYDYNFYRREEDST